MFDRLAVQKTSVEFRKIPETNFFSKVRKPCSPWTSCLSEGIFLYFFKSYSPEISEGRFLEGAIKNTAFLDVHSYSSDDGIYADS